MQTGRSLIACAVVAGMAIAATSAEAQLIRRNFILDGTQEVPPNASTATGTARLVVDVSTGLYELDLFVTGITLADLRAAGPNGTPLHFHNAPVGVNGGIVVDAGFHAGGFVAEPGGIRATVHHQMFGGMQGGLNGPPVATNIANLLAGALYLNVHTNAFPGGEIRGQAVPAPSAAALLAIGGLVAARRRRR